MKITSPSFENNRNLLAAYTCDGKGVNPPLDIEGVPDGAKSLALILRDSDAVEGVFIHWLVWNIDPQIKHIKEDYLPMGAVQGKTTDNRNRYVGPCPPRGTHRYIFTVYALDIMLDLPNTTNAEGLMQAMGGHILGQAEIIGKYR